MAYIPTEWKNGDVITAEKLNKLEEGVQEANGEKLVTVFDDSITTASSGNLITGLFTPTAPIAGDSILVKFENVVYELPKTTLSFGTGYGEFDNGNSPILTNYPCAIGVSNGQYYFFTSEANTYTIEIKVLKNSSFFIVTFSNSDDGPITDKTFEEISNAYDMGKTIIFKIVLETTLHGTVFNDIIYDNANISMTSNTIDHFSCSKITNIQVSDNIITHINAVKALIDFNNNVQLVESYKSFSG